MVFRCDTRSDPRTPDDAGPKCDPRSWVTLVVWEHGRNGNLGVLIVPVRSKGATASIITKDFAPKTRRAQREGDLLLLMTADYFRLLPTTVHDCLRLLSPTYYHLLIFNTADYLLLLTTTHYCPLLPTTIYYYPLRPTTNHYCPL